MVEEEDRVGKNPGYYIAASAAVSTVLLYLLTLRHQFVEWDDSSYVVKNQFIRSLDLAFLKWTFSAFHSGNWHPLTWISHALDYAMWGLNPMGHHLGNVILHGFNTALVVLLVLRLLIIWKEGAAAGKTSRSEGASFLVVAAVTGLLFGFHPLHVESVAWVSERKDLLCGFFYLLAMLAYLNYAGRAAGDSRPPAAGFFNRYRYYFITLAFFSLALLSKAMAVTLPVVLFILDWYPCDRIRSYRTLLASVREKVPFLLLSVVSSVLTMAAQTAGGNVSSLTGLPFSMRALVSSKALIAYLGKMLLPVNLVPFYSYPPDASVLSFPYAAAILLVVGITAACVLLVKTQKIWLAAWAYYLVTLIPVLGIVQVGTQAMADRYTYLPSLGPFLLIGLAAGRTRTRLPGNRSLRNAVVAGAASVFLVMTYLTVQQIFVWQNSISLLTAIIEKEPSVPRAYYGLGLVFSEAGQPDRAIDYYTKALALDPSFCEVYGNRGLAFEKTGQVQQALDDYNRAIALNPLYSDAYNNRGFIAARMNQFDKALADFDKAIACNPSCYQAYSNRGSVFGKLGRFERALADFDKALGLYPDDPLLLYNRGLACLKSGRPGPARTDFQKACDLGNTAGCEALQQPAP